MTGWKWQRGRTLTYLTIPGWSKLGVMAAFAVRTGGASENPYSSLNLALHVGDDPEAVLHNRALFLGELGYESKDCVAAEQVHGTRVLWVTAKDRGRGMQSLEDALPKCDGMVTGEKVGLLCFYADCVPIYFFEPRTGLIGLAHAGWLGTAHKIAQEMLTIIKSAGGRPENCLAAIGPCIGPCCYEVGENVLNAFSENFHNLAMFSSKGEGKYYLDLVKANQMLLLAEGLWPENISIAGLCTACQPENFFSYRRDGVTGRMAAFIGKSLRG
ncbi:MAG TPA: peptidoglycan editing factor PgeF [Peptococcaceae bacterium]|nr:peptidoglycan editing factor PgeF [Peptococcaceae bacterium]